MRLFNFTVFEIFIFISITLSFNCCKHRLKEIIRPLCSKIEIYCYCFSSEKGKVINDSIVTQRPAYCESFFPISPQSLINEKNLYDSTSDINLINSLQDIIFTNQKKSEKIDPHMIDARLIIVFEKNDLTNDIFSISLGNNVFYNDYSIIYPFDIIDSIQKILKKDEIYCPPKILLP